MIYINIVVDCAKPREEKRRLVKIHRMTMFFSVVSSFPFFLLYAIVLIVLFSLLIG